MFRSTLAVLAATAVLSGCATFSESSAIARFDGEEFTQDDLDAALGGTGTQSADAARAAINDWLFPLLIEADLLSDEAIAQVDDELIGARFAQGMEASGIACPDVIVAASGDLADDAADRLRDGESFDVVFTEANVDPNVVQGAGGCIPLNQINPAMVDSPDVVALLAIDAENPVASTDLSEVSGSDLGLVVVHRPFDELNETDQAVVRSAIGSAILADGIDVYVDSRYGVFDPAVGVVPLGR